MSFSISVACFVCVVSTIQYLCVFMFPVCFLSTVCRFSFHFLRSLVFALIHHCRLSFLNSVCLLFVCFPLILSGFRFPIPIVAFHLTFLFFLFSSKVHSVSFIICFNIVPCCSPVCHYFLICYVYSPFTSFTALLILFLIFFCFSVACCVL